MDKIITSLIKELRERTGAGIMDCKKALIEADNNIDLAIENMRITGAIKAAKKAGNITSDGIIGIKVKGNYGVILEVNCQTDFAAKSTALQVFTNKILDTAFSSKNADINTIKVQFEEERIELVARIGENINIRRFAALEGNELGAYQHGTRIGVLVATKNAHEKLTRQLAMHIAACKPEFITPSDISSEIIEKEYQIQLDIAMQYGKTKEIAEQIVKGRMGKFFEEISLTGQSFIMNSSKTIAQLLKEHDSVVTGFVRFEVGEGIEKK